MNDGPKLTWFGKLILLVMIGGCAVGAYFAFQSRGKSAPSTNPSATTSSVQPTGGPAAAAPTASNPAPPNSEAIQIGIAYGTEKKRWMEWAVEEFRKTPEGSGISVDLIGLGSIEAAQAIIGGDQRIHVWSPASSLYKETFVRDFEAKQGRQPIDKEEILALTPMVFVSWAERAAFFEKKYGAYTFPNISAALKEKSGWASIAQKPEWGFFKFAHTHPNQSNSGLLALVLMAYDYHGKMKNLTLADILDSKFQSWLIDLETSVTDLPNSTGNMMKDMVLKGPSTYDTIFVYESVAIDYLKNAEGRWGELHVSYPRFNLWSDNPYYVLNTPWSDKRHRQASQAFLNFLMSEPAQKMALTHGFRPGNPNVPIIAEGSPFQAYQKFGLKVDLSSVCEAPKAEILHNLLVGWNNNVRNR